MLNYLPPVSGEGQPSLDPRVPVGRDLLAVVESGELDPSFIVTHELSLADAPRGYELFERKLDGAIKVLLHP